MFGEAIDIQQLTEKCFGNAELVSSLIERFEDSIREHENEFSIVVADQDFEAIRALAHRLAGESGTMCAWRIHETAKQICEACHHSSRELIEIKLNQFSIDVMDVREFSRKLKQKNLQTL